MSLSQSSRTIEDGTVVKRALHLTSVYCMVEEEEEQLEDENEAIDRAVEV